LFEEIGWRGYLQPKLLNKHSIGAAGLMVGVLWGIWHLPLFFIRGMFHTNLPLDQFFITVVLISVIICFLQEKARSGIWPVLLVHSFMNLTQDVTPLFNEQGHTLWTITNGVLGLIILTYGLFAWHTASRRM
jgi:membrane protease YdiL (CAAX protease family)